MKNIAISVWDELNKRTKGDWNAVCDGKNIYIQVGSLFFFKLTIEQSNSSEFDKAWDESMKGKSDT